MLRLLALLFLYIFEIMFHMFHAYREERQAEARAFHRIAGMRHVTGLVDGTLISIAKPSGVDGQLGHYVDRKNHTSLNVQVSNR